jgi:imidazolonepropionase-like amidohydrolase
LIDCHAHVLSSMKPQLTVSENILTTVAGISASARVLLEAANAREALEAGITTVRNVGHSGVDGDAALRDAIEAGQVPGPRMLAATRKLTPPGGQGLSLRHEIAKPILDLEYLPVSGAEEAAVRCGRRWQREPTSSRS